jgi:hypothetical protein
MCVVQTHGTCDHTLLSKFWDLPNSGPRMIALARSSSNYKLQTYPLVREDAVQEKISELFKWNAN